MESVFGRNWSQRIPWYPSRHLSQKKQRISRDAALQQSEETQFLLQWVRAERQKNNVVAFPDCTQNFICTKSGDRTDPHSRLVWNQPTLRKATLQTPSNRRFQTTAYHNVSLLFPLLLIETHSTVSGLTSNFQSGDFVRWRCATIIKQLMTTERCTSCPPEMERPRLCFNCLQLLTHSSPVNCHHVVHTTAY